MKSRIWTFFLLSQIILIGTTNAQDSARKAYDKLAAFDSGKNNDDTKNVDLDLKDPKFSQVLLQHLNSQSAQKKGTKAAHVVLAELLKRKPAETLEWILYHFPEFTTFGRAMGANSLSEVNYQECCRILFIELSDRGIVVDKHAAAVAPGPYEYLRVCDFAFNSLVQTIGKDENFPSDLPKALFGTTLTKYRDQAIKRLMDWWTQESPRLLKQRPSLTSARPSLEVKIRALEKVVGSKVVGSHLRH